MLAVYRSPMRVTLDAVYGSAATYGDRTLASEVQRVDQLAHKIRGKEWSWPISRVLSWAIIPLGQQLLTGSSNLPDPHVGHI